MSPERFRVAVVVLLAVAVVALAALAVPTVADFLRYQDFMSWCLVGHHELSQTRAGFDCTIWWRHGSGLSGIGG